MEGDGEREDVGEEARESMSGPSSDMNICMSMSVQVSVLSGPGGCGPSLPVAVERGGRDLLHRTKIEDNRKLVILYTQKVTGDYFCLPGLNM